MARSTQRKHVSINETLIPLAQPGAVLLIWKGKPRILHQSNHRLVKDAVLTEMKEQALLEPFVELAPGLIKTTLSLRGRDLAEWEMKRHAGYTQMQFKDLEKEENEGGGEQGSVG